MQEKSCGTVLFTMKNGTPHYLLTINPHNKICGFPKGHMEEAESEAETALRETWEETSVRPTLLDGFRVEISYLLSADREKTVVFFLGRFESQEPHRNGSFEDFNYKVLPYEQARKALTFRNTRDVLRRANDYLAEYIKKKTI